MSGSHHHHDVVSFGRAPLPQEAPEEAEQYIGRFRSQKPPGKQMEYYQDLSDPNENRRGYSKGFYQSWDSKAKKPKKTARDKLKTAREKLRNLRRYRDLRMAKDPNSNSNPNPNPSRHPFSGFYNTPHDE